ncbi:MAG: phosphatase PAP2 family protein [Solobacterium sp.]|nr:phosphatase PAP2 family protein [Solobacterium sp.]
MDITILLWLQNLRNALGPAVAYIALLLSNALAAVAIVIPFVLFWSFDKRRGQMMLAIFSGSLMLNQIIKLSAAVYRPWVRDPRITPPDFAKKSATGYSFPSTHTQVAATAYGDLADDYLKTDRRKSLLWFSLILLAGFLRVYLGVHTPQDILVGMMSALLMIPVCTFIFEKLAKHREQEIIFAVIFVFLSAAAVLFALNKAYPMDYADGVLLVDPAEMLKDFMLSAGISVSLVCGGIIEHKTINFSTDCPMREKLIRSVSGLAGAGVLYLATKLSAYVLSPLSNAMFRGLLIGFYAVLVHPYLFTKFAGRKKASEAPDPETSQTESTQ